MKQNNNKLNKAQYEAVVHYQGPCLVLAGPGSGKTLVIVKRIEMLLKQYQVKPEEILVVDDVKLACMMAQPVGIDVAFAAWSKAEFPELTVEMRQLCKFAFDSTKELEKFLFD